MFAKRFLPIMLTAAATIAWMPLSAFAQASEGSVQQDVQQNKNMAQAALQVALLVDHNKADEVWDGSSFIAKQHVTRGAFVSQIDNDRQSLGALISRSVAAVSYRQSDGKQIPQGIYANVAFATRFAGTKQTVRELISFHLDNDRVWRVSGYTLR